MSNRKMRGMMAFRAFTNGRMPDQDMFKFTISGRMNSPRLIQHAGSDKKLFNFCSTSYLGIVTHPRLVARCIEAVEKYGTGYVGAPCISGYTDYHIELENRLAGVYNMSSALLMPSASAANLGIIPSLVGKGDVIISDKRNHSTIIDGCEISEATTVTIPHNDMSALERALIDAPTEARKLVVADGVFSMAATIFNLPAARAICNKYNAKLLVDECHALGTNLGTGGLGTIEHFGNRHIPDYITGTIGKSLGSCGGYIVFKDAQECDDLMYNNGRVFSAGVPASAAAVAIEALDVLGEDDGGHLERLVENVDYMHEALGDAIGFKHANKTPIFPIHTKDPAGLALCLYNNYGIYTLPVSHPVVPANENMLRVTITGSHTKEDVDWLAHALHNEMENFTA